MATHDDVRRPTDTSDETEKPSAERLSSNVTRDEALELDDHEMLMATAAAHVPKKRVRRMAPNVSWSDSPSPSNSSTDTVELSGMANIFWSPSNSNIDAQLEVMATDDISIQIESEARECSSQHVLPLTHEQQAREIEKQLSHTTSSRTPASPSPFTPQTELQAEKKSLVKDLIQPSKTSLDPNSWKIFKVPYRLRQVNEKAYEPRVISIGPYHNGKEHLKVMEIIKEGCLRRIIAENNGRAKAFVRAMTVMEADARKCYPETLPKSMDSSNAFVKMMILDGCFIADLFGQNSRSKRFFKMNRTRTEISYDLLLLENQLPFFVLSELHGIIKMSDDEVDQFANSAQKDDCTLLALAQMPEFGLLAHSYLEKLVPGPVVFPQKYRSENINDLQCINHLLGLVHDSWIPHHTEVECQGTLKEFIRCAKEPDEAGIKFVKKDKNGEDEDGVVRLFDIDFTDAAQLKIPALEVNDNTELILRNFMAYEQFIPIMEPSYVLDYVVFMDNLIDSGKDVQLLCHSGVIVNWLGDDETVAQMFNKLRDFTYSTKHSFYYKKIYNNVNDHCQKRWNKWKAKLKKDYFNSPWSTISVIAAIVLLLLTMVQTIFSVLSYVHPN